MMSIKCRTIPALPTLAALLVSGVVQASPGLGIDAGSTGGGAHLSMPLHAGVNLRIGSNYAKVHFSGSTPDSDYDYTVRLQTHDLLLDWFPAHGTFRITGGVAYNGNEVRTVTTPRNGTYTVGGVTYDAADAGNIRGDVHFRKYAPYLGIGWGNAAGATRGWHFVGDIGVLFQGSPHAELSSEGCRSTLLMSCAQLERDIEKEEAELNQELEDWKFYPVIRLGLAYSF